MSITLEPEQEKFIQEQLARGRFKSANEVLDHALLLIFYEAIEDGITILRVVSGRQNLETLFDENLDN